MLAFEPPHFAGVEGDVSTVGGMVAAGWSGPARASVGAVRDFVLGIEIINGQAELLRFGGTVMKNVAGYDVSRLMAAAGARWADHRSQPQGAAGGAGPSHAAL
jgi:FAD/FMN-containing dehydrogenases